MQEVWKDIIGYEGLYQVSNLGRVKSLQRVVKRTNGRPYTAKEKILGQFYSGRDKDYLKSYLSKNGKKKSYQIHRLVAIAFIPNVQNKPQVNHIDGNKSNNNILNLEWCTNSENQIHAYRMGLNHVKSLKGYLNPCSKEVIKCDLDGNEIECFGSMKEAERMTGIHYTNISACCKGKTKTAGGFKWIYKHGN